MKVREILKDNSEWMPNKNYDVHNPKVSVLLPTFRRAKDGFFERAVMSVLNQTFKDLELIIIDDASTDGTKELIKYFMETDERVHCIRHIQNVGLPAISEYEGYMKAKGEYIAFIFDDNEWEKEYIQKTILFMIRENVKASFGIVKLHYGEREEEVSLFGDVRKQGESFNLLYKTNLIGNGGVVLHKEVIENVGLYDPHISLTRTCDWDLWQRILKKYDFIQTDIYASSEYGYKLEDSLGNSLISDYWIHLEQITEDRDDMLKPKNFLEYDILNTLDNNTLFFEDFIKQALENYKNKFWLKKIEEREKVKKNVERKKRVLVVSSYLGASEELVFFRLQDRNPDIVFRYQNVEELTTNILSMTDICIISRDLYYNEKILKKCVETGIPCYYYIDDNFIELWKDIKNRKVKVSDIEKKHISQNIFKINNIKPLGVKGIICTSENLKNYFLGNKIHSNVKLLNPLIEGENFEIRKSEKVSVGFMGGIFRSKLLKEIVWPAIVNLSEEIEIEFLIPEPLDKNEKKLLEEYKAEKIQVKYIERSVSLRKVLRNYKKEGVDILVHCGEEIKNNIYKTENSLLNALKIGAVLLTSNVEPYKSRELSKDSYIRVENTIKDWYEKLRYYALNKNEREKLYERAKIYCLENYSGKKETEEFQKLLSENKSVDYFDILNRYTKLEGTKYKKERNIVSDGLYFSKLIKNKKEYNFKCKTNKFSEIGLIFASFGDSKGYVVLRIKEKGKIIREASLDLDNIIKNDITYFKLEEILETKNKIFTLEIEFFYDKGSVLMGVFENTEKRTFKYKLFNKLGYPIKGLDVLYIDYK